MVLPRVICSLKEAITEILACYYSLKIYFTKEHTVEKFSLKAKYLVLLKNVRDKNQFTFLAHQVYPEHSQSL